MEEKEITLKDGRQVRLLAEDGRVIAYDSQGSHVGCVGYRIQDGDYHHGMPDVLELYDADVVENYRCQGIATECVRFAVETTGIEFVTAPHVTDTTRTSGNYLTADGAALVASLRAKGIVAPHQNDLPE
jgi:ribosomal protein S18 acetylase RimI-like enzyme